MKRALVIGITSSLGTAIAQQLREAGYVVYGTSRKAGDSIYELDLSDTQSITAFTKEFTHTVDVCISTVSAPVTLGKFTQTTEHEFDAAVRIARNHIPLMQGLLPRMNEGGILLFTLSEMMEHGGQYASPYVISKHLLLGLLKSLAQEIPARILRVNAIAPGMMDTPFSAPFPRFVKEQYLKQHNRTVLLTADEVAHAVIEVLSTEKTGEIFAIQ